MKVPWKSNTFCLLPLLGPGRSACEVWQFSTCFTDKSKTASSLGREGSRVKSCLYPGREIISNPLGDKSFLFLSPSWDDSLFDLLQSFTLCIGTQNLPYLIRSLVHSLWQGLLPYASEEDEPSFLILHLADCMLHMGRNFLPGTPFSEIWLPSSYQALKETWESCIAVLFWFVPL